MVCSLYVDAVTDVVFTATYSDTVQECDARAVDIRFTDGFIELQFNVKGNKF